MIQETARQRALLKLSPYELLQEVTRTGEKFTRTEWVPMNKFVDEAMVVHEQHADDLYQIMKRGGFGQTQGIIARCRIGGNTERDVLYDIADGFHRHHGIKKHDGNDALVKTEVLYNCSDEELYDQRIQAQTAMKGIKFARLATFMDGAWNSNKYKKRLTLAQAVKMTHNDSSGKNLGLADDEATEIKEWVKKKAELWMMDVVTLDNNIRTIRAVSPELVKKVRLGGSFEKGKLALTLEQLRIFEAHLPLQYDIQEKIASFVASHSLSTVEISALTAETAQVIDEFGDKFTDARLQKIFEEGRWRQGLIGATSPEPQKVYFLAHIRSAVQRLEDRVRYYLILKLPYSNTFLE